MNTVKASIRLLNNEPCLLFKHRGVFETYQGARNEITASEAKQLPHTDIDASDLMFQYEIDHAVKLVIKRV